jgi:hypothetical protein
MDDIQFALKFNNACTRVACVRCGDGLTPDVGYQVVSADGFGFLCDPCSFEVVPELAALRSAADAMYWLYASYRTQREALQELNQKTEAGSWTASLERARQQLNAEWMEWANEQARQSEAKERGNDHE